MPPPPARATLPVCLEVPDRFLPKARYSVETLLDALGLRPVYGATPEPGGLYYGPGEGVEGGVAIKLRPETLEYFAEKRPYEPDRADWLSEDAERWPILFGSRAAPDFIASAFFWLSGWQEMVAEDRDIHGRFPYVRSLQNHWSLATRPVVDFYRARLHTMLQGVGVNPPGRSWGGKRWALCPTHDVDYLRKWRPGILKREILERAILNRNRESGRTRRHRVQEALKGVALSGDPYLHALHRMRDEVMQRGGTATYFVKSAAHHPNDVSYRLSDRAFQRFVGTLQERGFEVGLHPSYNSFAEASAIAKERERVRRTLGLDVTSLRQHYLRYDPARTARAHEACGFELDSTLGFAEQEGFRRGTSVPFRIYDLAGDRATGVWEMPLALMEGTLFVYRGMGLEDANKVTREVMATCQRFGGACITLWHNVLWDEADHPGWGEHFLTTLDQAYSMEARIISLREAVSGWA